MTELQKLLSLKNNFSLYFPKSLIAHSWYILVSLIVSLSQLWEASNTLCQVFGIPHNARKSKDHIRKYHPFWSDHIINHGGRLASSISWSFPMRVGTAESSPLIMANQNFYGNFSTILPTNWVQIITME